MNVLFLSDSCSFHTLTINTLFFARSSSTYPDRKDLTKTFFPELPELCFTPTTRQQQLSIQALSISAGKCVRFVCASRVHSHLNCAELRPLEQSPPPVSPSPRSQTSHNGSPAEKQKHTENPMIPTNISVFASFFFFFWERNEKLQYLSVHMKQTRHYIQEKKKSCKFMQYLM